MKCGAICGRLFQNVNIRRTNCEKNLRGAVGGAVVMWLRKRGEDTDRVHGAGGNGACLDDGAGRKFHGRDL